MKYFVGTYTNKVDRKGRVSLPSTFRDVLSTTSATHFYMFRHPTKHVLEAGGEDLMDFIATSIEQNAPMFSEEESLLTEFMGGVYPVNYDKTGRFVLPDALATFAGITSKAVFVGTANRFQIWEPDLHKNTFAGHRERFAQAGLTLKKPHTIPNHT